MKLLEQKTRGFTLMELIVVIGIMAILMALSIPSFHNYSRRAKVKTASKDIRSLLWEAQALSLAPRDPDTEMYNVSIIDCGGGPCTSPFAIDASPAEDLGRGSLGSVKLDPSIEIQGISIFGGLEGSVGTARSVNAIRISFLTGNRTGGEIGISDTSGGNGQRAEIIIGSSLTPLRYKITINTASDTVDLERLAE